MSYNKENEERGLLGTTRYTSFWGKILRKWDWWIYCMAIHSLRRMTIDNPGFAYLMELQIIEWNKKLNISPELRSATELFHESMRDLLSKPKPSE